MIEFIVGRVCVCVCDKQRNIWLFFQALAQNSELRERLCKIHVESHVVEPTLLNLTAPAQVGAGPEWLHPPPPPSLHELSFPSPDMNILHSLPDFSPFVL